ncbi:MAG: HU family DNA-binding protein [Mollicutes bacterium PWAP]|nr:HU family DNA-binding protein [Mollicutes bacterium PWAP]
MTRSQLIAKLAEETMMTKSEIESVLKAQTKIVTEAVASDDTVELTGLGKFSRIERKARQGVNPSTGAKISIAAKMAPKFKVSKSLKDAVV